MSDQAHILYDRVPRMICPFCHARMDVSTIEPFTKAICPSCNSEVTVPARLGAFLLTELLGTGGMGGVYRAHDETLGRDVAIKVMLKSLGDSPEFISSFRREAQAAAKLNHPSIAQIYSFGQEKGQPYIVMELIPGMHFDQMIAEPEPLDVPMIMKIGMDIAEGLQLAADANLIHGDIKPENILMDERNQAKLVDFGIAAKPSKGENEIWGTPYYIAPERVRRQRVDFRSDIYCLGGTLYHAVTQHPPFEGADAMEVVRARLLGPPVPPEQLRPGLDPAVSAIIMRMLQMEPAMRYPTYGSLLSDMRAYLSRVQPKAAQVAGKRIMIKGRKTTLPTTGSIKGATTTGAALNGGTTGRANTAAITSRTRPLMITRGMFPDGTLPQTEAQGAADAEQAAPAKWKKGCLIAAGMLVILLVIGGLATWLIVRNRAQTIAAETETGQQALAQQQAALATVRGQIAQSQADLVANANAANVLVTQAVARVEQALGGEFTERILREEPEAEDATEAAPAAAGGVAETPPAAADASMTNANAAADGTNAVVTVADAAAGTNAVVTVADAAAGTNAAAAVAEAPAVAESAPETPLPPLAQMARDVHQAAQPLRQAVRRAARAAAKAETLFQSIPAGTNAVTALSRVLGQLQPIAASMESARASAPGVLQATREKLDLLTREVERLAAEREKAAAEARQQEEARRAAEAEAERQAAESAAMAAEVARVAGVVQTQAENLLSHQYARVLDELRAIEGELRHDAGKQALKLAIKRITGLQDLREFLIKRLNETPFKAFQGWSVDRASTRTLTIRNSAGRVNDVSWENVGVAQMAQFIQFYLQDEQKTRLIPLRERFAQTINAAIYCVSFGGDSDSARAMARALRDKAIEMMPHERDETLSLLPELSDLPE